MMSCRELAEFLAGYLSGELEAGALAEFERHLRLCANCRNYLAGYKATIELGRRAFDDENAGVPPDVPEELVKAILASRKR
jgi:anti-sigma factor RsiW